MSKAPACMSCGKPLRRFRWRDEAWAHGMEWGNKGDGFFCGRTCGYAFAVVMVSQMKQGILIKSLEPVIQPWEKQQ